MALSLGVVGGVVLAVEVFIPRLSADMHNSWGRFAVELGKSGIPC
jgi:hypothetical protein